MRRLDKQRLNKRESVCVSERARERVSGLERERGRERDDVYDKKVYKQTGEISWSDSELTKCFETRLMTEKMFHDLASLDSQQTGWLALNQRYFSGLGQIVLTLQPFFILRRSTGNTEL